MRNTKVRTRPTEKSEPATEREALHGLLKSLSPKMWHALLKEEKRRRGVRPEQLAFVGIHNVAQYWWCAEYSVLKCRANEMEFFSCYVRDRLRYSLKLGKIGRLPTAPADLLSVGGNLTMADAESLLRGRQDVGNHAGSVASIAVDGVAYINAALEPEQRVAAEFNAMASGFRLGDAQQAPALVRGQLLESAFAQRHPTLRWNWQWEEYVLVGQPEGVRKKFVYEFKTTQKPFFLRFAQPVAETQADLYGHFWKRPEKRVQIHVVSDGDTVTIRGPVDSDRAIETLRRFQRVDAGSMAVRPAAWKCRGCDYRGNGCRLTHP